MIEIIGAPFDLGGKRHGARLGPTALRLAGLTETFVPSGIEVRDSGDLQLDLTECPKPGIRNFEPALNAISAVRSATLNSLKAGHQPLVLGGDHSLALGTVSAALAHFGEDLALLWIDAHTDMNTPATSPSGNLHGMPLGVLTGFASGTSGEADKQWLQLQSLTIPESPLKGSRVAWLGTRDVDPGEKEHLLQIEGEYSATMYDIDRFGLVECLQRFDKWMRGALYPGPQTSNLGPRALWISFDVDALDPILAPGTGTAVRGGLTYREMHLMGEMLHELLSAEDCPYKLAGLDLVEIDPFHDTHNETAGAAVEWIASLFGKTILGKR